MVSRGGALGEGAAAPDDTRRDAGFETIGGEEGEAMERWSGMTRGLLLFGLALGVAGAGRAEPPAVLDAQLGPQRTTLSFDALAARAALAPDQLVRVEEIGRDAHTSHHLVALRKGEEPHRHARHDLLIVMLRGHGSMLQGGEERAVGVGSILYVPRGHVHAFRNASAEPALAYVVYSPPFDGEDRIDVEPEGGARIGR